MNDKECLLIVNAGVGIFEKEYRIIETREEELTGRNGYFQVLS